MTATKDFAPTERARSTSFNEASARTRLELLLDTGSFVEFIGPEQREISPHLKIFDLPEQFDDGIVIGYGRLDGAPVLVAAQEGRFMGGAFGEVHGAKLTGLLRGAREIGTIPVLILFDTGGVRLQEANAGELAIAEIMRAVMEARSAGVKIIGLIGGRSGCYGGGGLIAGCCSALAVSEPGRIAVSGPEVIETNRGVEEFDSRERALVWRTMGGKHRRLLGAADVFADDTVQDFREAARELIGSIGSFALDRLTAEQTRLTDRLRRFGACEDAIDIWTAEGIAHADMVPELPADQFIALANRIGRTSRDAR
ncbi:biotin-independent malonate decarboxylase subunit beta [Bradyrhizobium sp. DOA1]|uniref:biotin-independent malonate decarboxylase subunit beta n=1 Tax=Bradyrhizobium sp. DOA1 TaxID=1126616 RepID=UPI00077C42AF|nr:biotin-independent malonate decarboxylase subunit beta [Bradyrhizobium sp. DOA1]KYH01455.1 malonate decarboxylase subunit beta [Bradyrhizobium sp. DOA1]